MRTLIVEKIDRVFIRVGAGRDMSTESVELDIVFGGATGESDGMETSHLDKYGAMGYDEFVK